MSLAEATELRRALLEPQPRAFVGTQSAARARWTLVAHALGRIDAALASADRYAILVKGAGLALTVYPEPWQRPMSDIDLLVRPADEERLARGLIDAGFEKPPGATVRAADRPFTLRLLGETRLLLGVGPTRVLLEMHPFVDSIVRRPVEYEAIFERALPLSGMKRLQVPEAEDHALLIALHLSASDFCHPVGLIDMELLLRQGLDLETLDRRASDWKLRTSLWGALFQMRSLGSLSATDALVKRYCPSRLRRAAIDLRYRLNDYPGLVDPGPRRMGLSWCLRQTLLRDDLGRWSAGIAAYSILRGIERGYYRFEVKVT